MAGKSQQLPRPVPNTLLQVQFVQRGGKLYKILLPIPLKHKNVTNASVSEPTTSPIVFEARGVKRLENITQKSSELSPLLKSVTLSPAEYKTIPLFRKGERIIDANWLPEETECINQLVKDQKSFPDTKSSKIISTNLCDSVKDSGPVNVQKNVINENLSTEFISSINQTVDDIRKVKEAETNFAQACPKSCEGCAVIKQAEKIVPVCELKMESSPSNVKMFEIHSSNINSAFCPESKSTLPLNGENCIITNMKPDVSSLINKAKSVLPTYSGNVKIADMQPNNSILTALRDSGNSKTINELSNGKYLISLKENNNYFTKQTDIIILSKDDNIASVEETTPIPSNSPKNKNIEVVHTKNITNSFNEERSLLVEKLKNARTMKIHPHGNSSALTEEKKTMLDVNLAKTDTKEPDPGTNSSVMFQSPINPESAKACKTMPIKPVSVSSIKNNKIQIENQPLKSKTDTDLTITSANHCALSSVPATVMLRLQPAENISNTCGVPVRIALKDHDYALKYPYMKKPDKRSTLPPEDYGSRTSPVNGKDVSNYTLRSVLRPKSLSTDMCTVIKTDKISRNALAMQQKARGRKPSVTFQEVSIVQNQNCIGKAISENNIHLQHQKFSDGMLSHTFPGTTITEKQNSTSIEKADSTSGFVNRPTLVKNVIKLLMPKSFSNNCSSENTAQALSRIAKLNAATGNVHQNSVASTKCHLIKPKYTKTYTKSQISSNTHSINTASNKSIMSPVSHDTKKSEKISSEDSDSSVTDEEFNIMEPEVLITESNDTFIFENGKLVLCPSRKPIQKKKELKKLPNNNEGRNITIDSYKITSDDEIIDNANNIQSKETSNEEKQNMNHIQNKESSCVSLKRIGKELESIHNSKRQRESLLPPSPKIRKLFICRTEKAASCLLQSCFVWLDKMDEQYLSDGRLNTTEISEDVLFNLSDTSQSYVIPQHDHKHCGSKAAYLDGNPIVIIEPSSSNSAEVKSELHENNGKFSTEKVEERKEADNRMADVLRLLEEKRRAIEALRQKNMSRAITSAASQILT